MVGRRAVLKTDEEVHELRLLAKDAPGFAKPLRQLLQTIDDRSRGVEPDRRAAASGPPAGDKTHTTSSRAGFTGMEAIWNFFYWQTLSTNALDDVGHVLRLTALVNECSPYEVKPDEAHIETLQPVPRPDAAGRDDAGSDRQAGRPRRRRRPGRPAPGPGGSGVRSGCRAGPPLGSKPRTLRPRLPARPMRRGSRQLGASPVLIGAVTVMIAIVAVFISYQANNGLPFVPTYQLEAQVPNGAKLVKGNEVRAGGFRVGIVKDIKSDRVTVNGKERAIAVLDLKLDKAIEPLAVDTTLLVRPRSALGLKYVELIPGRAQQDLPGRRHDPDQERDAERARARGRALELPARDARGRPQVAPGLRRTRSPAVAPRSTRRSASSSRSRATCCR